MTQVDQAATIWNLITVALPILLVLAAIVAFVRNCRFVRAADDLREWSAHSERPLPRPRIVQAAHHAVF